MPKKTLREQIKELAIFVVAKHPNRVSYRMVMIYMNCGATTAREYCKTLAEVNPSFEYQNGDIRFTGDPVKWAWDLFKEDK